MRRALGLQQQNPQVVQAREKPVGVLSTRHLLALERRELIHPGQPGARLVTQAHGLRLHPWHSQQTSSFMLSLSVRKVRSSTMRAGQRAARGSAATG